MRWKSIAARSLSLALVGVAAAPAARAGEVENLLVICSSPDSQALDALNACRRVADVGRLDARRKALVLLNAGIAAYTLGLYKDAIAYETAALEADSRLADAYENRAQAHGKLGQLAEALSDYASAISVAPRSARAYLGRGILMLENGAVDRAMPDFGRAIEIDPQLSEAYYNRGLALMQMTEYGRAEQDFTYVIGLNPADANAYLNRARARSMQGNSKARGDFDRAIALKPEWAAAWYLRGRFLDKDGKVEEANSDFQRAYELGYSDPWLIERMRKLSGG